MGSADVDAQVVQSRAGRSFQADPIGPQSFCGRIFCDSGVLDVGRFRVSSQSSYGSSLARRPSEASRPKADRGLPIWAAFNPFRGDFGQIRTEVYQTWPNFTKLGAGCANFGGTRPTLERNRPNLDRFGATLADLGQPRGAKYGSSSGSESDVHELRANFDSSRTARDRIAGPQALATKLQSSLTPSGEI